MINKIISFSIKNKTIIGMIMIAWIGLGIYSMQKVPIDAVPDITNNQVQIITVSPNLGTEDIERFVTYPVELSMANLPDVEEIRSISRFGLSVVTIVFKDKIGTFLPRQLVGEKLNEISAEIPEQFGKPFIGPISTGLGEIYQYTLEVDPTSTKRYSITELREIQDWIVKRQMAMIPGVVEVNSLGGYNKEYEIAIDPNKIKSMGISMDEIFHAVAKNNANTGGAYIEKDRLANFIRGEGLARSKEDLEQIVIKSTNYAPILIRDIAIVKIGHSPRYGAITKDGKGETVGGMVMLLKDGNSNDVIKRIKARVIEIEQSLPEGIRIVPFLDRSKLIANTTSTVRNNLFEGGLIVIFVLVIFLGNFRGGLIVASTIPLSLLFAFIMMNIFGVWSNLMSLGAIDFGIIVDGSVIIVESIVFMISQKLRTNPDIIFSQKAKDDISYKASSKMMNAAFFGQLIILIVFIPILSLTGVEGKMFAPMAYAFSFAVIGAMILCLTYVPAIAAFSIKNNPSAQKGFGDKFIEKLTLWYQPILLQVLDFKKTILAIAIISLVGAGFLFSRMGGEFIPQLDEGDLAFHAFLKPGSSLTETVNTTTKIEAIVMKKFPQVESVVSKIGVAEIPTDPMPMDIADIFAILKPTNEWPNDISKDELIAAIKKELSVLPGINFEFSQPIEMRFNELLTGVREDIAIKLYGDDLTVLANKAKEISKLVEPINGVADLKAESIKGLPQITIKYDRRRIAQYGLSIEDVNQTINTAFSGRNSGYIFEGERKFQISIRLDKPYKKGIEDISNLFITLPNQEMIPLRELASIDYQAGPMQISRDGTKRRINVGINVRGRDIESLIKEIKQKLNTSLELPPGYYIRYGGAFENLERAKQRLKTAIPVALGLIFVLLFLALKSLPQTLMIYTSIPLATIGGVFSLWIRDLPFSISAGIGFIVLFGVAVLNGLVLISSFNDLKKEGISDLKNRILRGTSERIKPIFLTASTDILGFLPMAISSSAGAEVQRPLATVVIGGLVTSSILTLIILPILYFYLENKSSKKNSVMKPSTLIVLIVAGLIFIPKNISAQSDNILTLEKALEYAIKNNGQLASKALTIKKEQTLRKSSLDLEKTNFDISYGQMNSKENDVALYIGQSFKFPTYYSNQAKLSDASIVSAELSWKSDANEIKNEIKKIWFEMVYLFNQKKLVNFQNSIYTEFQRAADLHYKTLESSKLEYITAQAKVMQAKNKLIELKTDIEIQKQRLFVLLDTSGFRFDTSKTLNKINLSTTLGTSVENNPSLQLLQQETKILEQEKKVKQADMLPEFGIGYFNQSMKGYNGTEYLDASTRFTGVNASIAIPIWAKPNIAQIQAKEIEKQASEAAAKYYSLRLNSLYQQTLQHLNKLTNSLYFYERLGLEQANLILENAQKSFKNGEIEYIEYVQNVDQALQIKSEYLSRLNDYNQTSIQLEYLSGI